MDYTPPTAELSELIRKHSSSYREFIKTEMLRCVGIGERFSTRDMTRSLLHLGHDVKDLSWWKDGEFMSCIFRKVGRGKWQRVQ